MDNLLIYLQSLTSLSSEGWTLLQTALTHKTYKKHELLLKEGTICNTLFFIEKGFCKSYYEVNGLIKNTGFFFENEMATNINSFGAGAPSEYNIIACEKLRAVLFDKVKLFQIAKQSPEIETLGRHCIRRFASKREAFAQMFQLYSPEQRLAYIELNHPEMIQRVSLSQLSSFLGVARETLSRIRKRRSGV